MFRARRAARLLALVSGRRRRLALIGFAGVVVALTVVGGIAARVQHATGHASTRTASTEDGYRAAVLADSPVAFWKLDEATGTSAADATGNGNTGTYGYAYTHSTTVAPIGDDDAYSFGSGSSSRGVTASLPAASLNVGTSGTLRHGRVVDELGRRR